MDGTYSVSLSQYFSITLKGIPNPLDPGILAGYPTVSLYDNLSGQIKMKTYDNLNTYLTPNFQHNGSLIILANDNPNFYIEAGTYTNDILISLKIASKKDITIQPSFDSSFKGQHTFKI